MCCRTSRSRAVSWSSSGSTADGTGRAAAGERVEHEAGEPRREDGVAAGHAAHRVGQLGAGDRLGHVAARAGADDRDHVLGGVGDRQREEALGRPRLARRRGSPATPPPPGICTSSSTTSGSSSTMQRTASSTVGGVAEHLDEAVELGAHAGAEQLVVVDDDDAGRSASSRALQPQLDLGALAGHRVDRRRRRRGARMRPTIDSRTPRRSAGTASGSKPGPRSRTNTSTRVARRPRRRRTPAAPPANLAALTIASRAAATSASASSSSGQSPTATTSTATPCVLLRLGGGELERGGERRALAARPAAVEPRAQLALLAAGEAGDLARVVGLALHQRERLQHGVVQVRGELGALLRAHALGALVGEPAHEPDPPRREDQRARHEHDDDRQQHVARGRERVVEVEEQQRRADHERDAERGAPERAAAPTPGARARSRPARGRRRWPTGARSARRRRPRARPATRARRRSTGPTRGTAAAARASAAPMPVATLHESRLPGTPQRRGARLAHGGQQRPRQQVGDDARGRPPRSRR